MSPVKLTCRDIDKFCQTEDSCVEERQRSGVSSAAQALHERQRAYEDLQKGQNWQRNGEALADEPSPAPASHDQCSRPASLPHVEKSASGSRSTHRSAGQVYSLDSALAAASSYSLHGSTTPDPKNTAEEAAIPEDMASPCRQESEAAAANRANAGLPVSAPKRPEAALMAARRLVGHAIFGLEVRRITGHACSGLPSTCVLCNVP